MVEAFVKDILENNSYSFDWSEAISFSEYTDTFRYLGKSDKYKVKLVSEKALICTEIEEHFKKEFNADIKQFTKIVTKN